jgi:hypothetical protein
MRTRQNVMRCTCIIVWMMLLGSGVASAQVLLRQPARFPIKIFKPGPYRLAENLDVKGVYVEVFALDQLCL